MRKNGQNENLTELVFILDRSGSMSGLEADTIGGFNSMIRKQKDAAGEAYVSTVLFDHEMEVVHDRVKLSEVPELTAETYYTRGSTALLDAVCSAIKHIGNVHKYARPEDRPAKTLFVITTDGYENASRNFDYKETRRLIERQRDCYGWEFLFLGSNIDAEKVAGNMGIERNRSVNMANDGKGQQVMYDAMAEAVIPQFLGAKKSSPNGRVAMDENWSAPIAADYKAAKAGRKRK